ncbi:MAG: CARDB domain-containing protein [Thermoplasmata archaeon]
MKTTMTKMGALMCVLLFLASLGGGLSVGGVGDAMAGARSPGLDLYLETDDITFTVGGESVGEAIMGSMVTIKATVHNSANSDTDSSQVTVSFFYDSLVIGSSMITDPIAPGEEASCQLVWDTTSVVPGDYEIRVNVNDEMIPDADTSNNDAYKSFKIIPIPKPHVYVDRIVLPNNALIGDPVVITAYLKNDGTKDMTEQDEDTVRFLVGASPLINGILPYPRPLPADNSTEVSVSYTWDTSQMSEGKFIIVVEVTSSKFKLESDIIELTLPTPNVYIHSIQVDKTSILEGESVTITVTLKNNGTANTTADEEIWLLVDDATSPTTEGVVTKFIPKGGVSVIATFIWNSSGAEPGMHTFTVKVPASSDPRASMTSPEVEVRPRLPNVELIFFEVTPSVVKSGETVLLSAKVTNTGTADAYNEELRFYLGSNETYPLAIKKVNVRVGTEEWVNYTYTPEVGENDTTFKFLAQYKSTLLEDSVLVKSTVPLRPDLVVESVDVPRLMIVNREYAASAVIANKGRAPAYNFTVKFNLGTEMPYLVKNLDLANGDTMTVNWTVKPTIPGTALRFKVEVDATGVVVESDEFNNINEDIKDIIVKPEPRASIDIQSVLVSKKSLEVKKGEKGSVKLTVTLSNSGEKDGTVLLVIKEGLVQLLSTEVSVPANSTAEFVYKWNLTGAKTHTARISIEGADAGLKTSQTIYVELRESTPGFGALVLLAAVLVGNLLLRRRKS